LAGLSADRRFATAYNAALQTAKMVIACAGYRVASTPGHHRLHFEAARIALGSSADRFLDYFETSRRKRNVIDYDYAFVATDTEAEEIRIVGLTRNRPKSDRCPPKRGMHLSLAQSRSAPAPVNRLVGPPASLH